MGKKIFHKGLLTLVLGFLAYSANAVPGIANPGDCLVVIKSDFVDNPYLSYNEQNSRVFEFDFSDGYSPATIQGKYTTVVVRGPAVRVRSVSSGANFGFRGLSTDYRMDTALPYKPGCLVIADFVFVKKANRTGRSIFVNYSFRKITDAERNDLLKQFRNDSAFSTWEKADYPSPADSAALLERPTGPSASSTKIAGGDSITITWNIVIGASSYRLYDTKDGTDPTKSNYFKVYSVTLPSKNLVRVSTGTLYKFVVEAVDSSGSSALSDIANTTTP